MMVSNFTLAEFVASRRARELGLNNGLPEPLIPAAWATLAMLQGIRDRLCAIEGRDVPIDISSGYRCQPLNKAVGGEPNSDHVRAAAVDFTAPVFGTPLDICRALAPLVSVLGIGQLIYERPRGAALAWVHASTRVPAQAVNRIITVTERGTLAGVVA
jgi:zinc D-Ala-D-Ala carboxypeptidase